MKETEGHMLQLTDVSAYYGALQVLKNISLHVDKGEIVGIIGANAAGKSTMLSCISGIIIPSSGSIIYNGVSLINMPPFKIVEMGLVQTPEGRLLFPKLSVYENLRLGAYSKRCREGWRERLNYVYELLPKLRERASQPAGTLSGGEAQMCAIGRGLMANPDFLMLDEPFWGLAPIIVSEIIELIKNIREQGTTVLLVEQSVKQTLKYTDRSYVIENGRIILEGSSLELINNSIVKKAYLGSFS
jgi:branched-chain amino acid transport system ATP-binding protein